MPHIVVHVSGDPQADRSHAIVRQVGDLTTTILGKDAAVIAIALIHVPRDQWFIGGRSLAEQERNAFHLDISITDETNTKAEKARYVQAVFVALSEVIGRVHDCSYVHLIDARATAYGYGGRTQEDRYQHR